MRYMRISFGLPFLASVLLLAALMIVLSEDAAAVSTAPWPSEVVDTIPTSYRTASLAIAGNQPYITYQYVPEGSPPMPELHFAERKNDKWIFQELGDAGLYHGWPSSLAIGTDGVFHVVYADNDAVRYTWKVTDTWQTETIIAQYKHWYGHLDAELEGGKGRPHVSYVDWDTHELSYAYYDVDNDMWQTEVAAPNANFADTNLAMVQGSPVIAYGEGSDVKAVIRSNGTWLAPETIGAGDGVSMAVARGSPVACFLQKGDLYYAQRGYGGWYASRIASNVSGPCSIAVDNSNRPVVVYNGEKGLMLGVRQGLKWTHGPTVEESGTWTELVVDGGGRPHLIYVAQGGTLKYASGPPTVADDLVADSLEVTQGVQDLVNSVRLVEGKRTYVRFHVHSSQGAYPTSAQLTVQGPAGERTLYPVNGNGFTNVRINPNRGTLSHAFLFELPTESTKGKISLRADLNPAADASDRNPTETDYANNTATANVNFEQVPVPRTVIYSVKWRVFGDSRVYRLAANEPEDMVKALQWIYPVPRLDAGLRTSLSEFLWLPTPIDIAFTMIPKRIWDRGPSGVRYYGMYADPGRNVKGFSIGIPGMFAAGVGGALRDYEGAHELGHAYGQWHPFAPPSCHTPYLPYVQPYHPGGLISPAAQGDRAIYGYDGDQLYEPSAYDYMNYCYLNLIMVDFWTSDLTYHELMKFFQKNPVSAASMEATAERTDRLLVVGSIAEDGEVTMQPFYVIPDIEDMLPRVSGDYSLVLRSAAGGELARYAFTPDPAHADPDGKQVLVIAELVPHVDGASQVDIEGPEGLLYHGEFGPNTPTIQLLAPIGGEVLDGDSVDVVWTANDADNDPLTFQVQHSTDNGATWQLVAMNLFEQHVTLDTSDIRGGDESLFRVWVTDGIHTASDVSDAPFRTPNHYPTAVIEEPDRAMTLAAGQTLGLDSTVSDVEDGLVEESQIQWLSNLDGLLGTGRQLSVVDLSLGQHTVTLQVTDRDGAVTTDSVQISIVAGLDQLPPLADALIAGPERIGFQRHDDGAQARLSIDNQNGELPIAWQATVDQPWLTLSAESGNTPEDDILVTYDASRLGGNPTQATIAFSSPNAPGESAVVNVTVIVPRTDIFYQFLPSIVK